jgi:hypothetical protein
MARPRSAFASLLAVVGGLGIVLGIVGLWANRTVGDSETFSSLAGGLLRQDVIVSRLAIAIVDPALERAAPEVRRQRRVIVSTTEAVLRNDRFVPIFEGVLEETHRSLVEGDRDVRLRLDPALDAVVVEVRRVAPPVADQLDDVDAPEPTILSAGQASRVRSFVEFERAASLAFLIGGLILVAISLVGGGPRALLPAGTTVAALAVLMFLLLFGVRTLVGIEVSGASRDAADSAFGVVVAGLQTTLIVTAVVGAVAAVVGAVLARRT